MIRTFAAGGDRLADISRLEGILGRDFELIGDDPSAVDDEEETGVEVDPGDTGLDHVLSTDEDD